MFKPILTAIFLGVVAMLTPESCNASPFYDISTQTIDGSPVTLSEYKGKVVLIVNVASKCGYTSQYEGLQKLYDARKGEGFVVLGVPSNDFGSQEPGTEAEIKHFCQSTYGANFPMLSKLPVVGPAKHPLYQYLTQSTGGQEVRWNFEKFLVDQTGKVVARFPSSTSPASSEIATALDAALKR